ncbi:hypothetical protein SAMN05421858_2233 [Haladaptatus litoreus]|uniref:Uncharacterized protein n=1 Tax=Haladaptatus litoreus TaxID=553468 RepID=A0A1N6ZYQ3_9EURY|nr:hypothetical protein [Haladaptatus litoreus]SIR31883.1 hypothetical protein SAMN05421858_2233 [Haladaptatus litoreus]
MAVPFDTGVLWIALWFGIASVLAVSLIWQYRTSGRINHQFLSGVFVCAAGGVEFGMAQGMFPDSFVPNALVIGCVGIAILSFARGVIIHRKRAERAMQTE